MPTAAEVKERTTGYVYADRSVSVKSTLEGADDYSHSMRMGWIAIFMDDMMIIQWTEVNDNPLARFSRKLVY